MAKETSELTHGQIRFASDARPTLLDGDYKITVTQSLDCVPIVKDAAGHPIAPGAANNPFTNTRQFSVLGPRFSLDPQEIHSYFPPEGSLGEYSNVLPHVMINRLTLPWERAVVGTRDAWPPWLALLIFHEGEEPAVVTTSLKKLGYPADQPVQEWNTGQEKARGVLATWATAALTKVDATKNPKGEKALKNMQTDAANAVFPTLKSEYGDHVDDRVNLILLPKSLEDIVPSWDDLPLTAHTRHAKAEDGKTLPDGKTEETFAAVIATRLPKPGGKTTVHLVSLEGHYEGNELKDKGQPRVYFSLANWHFACLEENFDFAGLLKNVDAGPLRLPASASPKGKAEDWLKQGLAPAAHLMRQGNRSVSWYRGPLLPGSPPEGVRARPDGTAISHADELVRFHSDVGMFDVSLAAAWELGRLLMLRDKRASLDLFNWKRAHAQSKKDRESLKGVLEHLPHQVKDMPPDDLPGTVEDWFADARLLKQIPFNYLVPDERMLPAESIRFFHLDPLWLECLLEGAFSIGFVSADHPPPPVDKSPVSGFLLRSAVVSGWPTLQVDGYSKALSGTVEDPADMLPLLRMDRLSKNTLLCLFDGNTKTVDIHLPPERLHFGFSEQSDNRTLYKQPRYLTEKSDSGVTHGIGTEMGNPPDSTTKKTKLKTSPDEYSVLITDDFWLKDSPRTLNLTALSSALQKKLKLADALTPDQFALQMIEGVEKVRFWVG